MTTTVYVAVLEYECEPSTLLGVYSTKAGALDVRAKEQWGHVAIYELTVDAPPPGPLDSHKEIQP